MPKNRVRTIDQERVWRKFLALLAKDEPNHPWVQKQDDEDRKNLRLMNAIFSKGEELDD